MGFFQHLFWPWSLIVWVPALLHFIRRRPDTYWLYVILFLGPVGAAIYIVAEVIPDAGMFGGQWSRLFARRKRTKELERATRTNPSAGNLEDLGGLLMENGKFAEARHLFDMAIAQRADTADPFYKRGVCAMELNDPAAALPDLERGVAKEPGYDFDRGAGLLAQAYAQTGRRDDAERLFRQVTGRSVLSETYLNFADLLASEGKIAEARQWAQKVLDKKQGMLGYQKRRERKWFWRASGFLRRVKA